MGVFSIMLACLTGIIALNTEFPVVYPQQTFLGDDGAVIIWPVVEGEFSGMARVNEILSYQNVTGESIEETRENYRLYGAGIVGASFQVKWMNTEYLDLTITVETLGAYSSSMVFYYLFVLDTGELAVAEDIFLPERTSDLVKLCDRELQNRLNLGMEIQEDYTFTEENLNNFGIRRGGIVFHYDFQFPHSIAASEPDGEIFFFWSDINEFLLPGARH